MKKFRKNYLMGLILITMLFISSMMFTINETLAYTFLFTTFGLFFMTIIIEILNDRGNY